MYPGPRDEPGRQDRDSPQDLLIAPGILMRLVPGSPASPYLGPRGALLKLVGAFFQNSGKLFECRGKLAHRADFVGRGPRGA